MASSSSNPSSTSSSTASTPSADRPSRPHAGRGRGRPAWALVLSEEEWPRLGTAPPTNPARAHGKGRGGRSLISAGVSQPQNSGVSQHVSPSLESGRESAADPTSTFAQVMWSTEGSSSSASASSEPFASSTTVASTPTDTRAASAASSDITLVPNASGSAPAVAASTAPEPNASTSSAPGVTTSAALEPDATTSTTPSAPGVETIVDAAPEADTLSSAPGVKMIADPASTPSSAPGVTKIDDLALESDALTSASSSARGVATIVEASLESDASASTPSSAPGVTTSGPGAAPTSSATTSAPGAAPTIPGLRDNRVAEHWGVPPRSVERCPGQQAFGGNGMSAVEALYPEPLWAWRGEEEVLPRVPLCWECRLRPAVLEARPCGHLVICALCYINRYFCPCCGSRVTRLQL